MTTDHTIDAAEIRRIGETIYGPAWQSLMAKAIGVPRQSVGHYLKSGGVSGAQAAAIIGLVARIAARELLLANEEQANVDARQAALLELLKQFDAR